MYGNRESLAKPKFKVGDKVRISKCKRKTFEKNILQIGQRKFSSLIKCNTQIQSRTKQKT